MADFLGTMWWSLLVLCVGFSFGVFFADTIKRWVGRG